MGNRWRNSENSVRLYFLGSNITEDGDCSPEVKTRSDEVTGVQTCALPIWIDWLGLLAVQRDSQASSPTPQFKGINSLGLSFLYSPTLTSTHDYWKNHSLD